MDGILGNLVVKISSDLTNLNAGLKNAEKNIQATSGKLTDYATKVGKSMTIVGAAITGAFALMVKSTVDYNDAIYETSVRTGIAVETLSKLKYVADQTESSFEAVAMGMKFLNRNIYEASSGNVELNRAFQALGVTLRDQVTGQLIKADEAFFQIADKFSTIENGAAKTALAMQIFGRGGEALIPVLNLGGDGIRRLSFEAERLGLVLTKDNAKAIDEFSDNMKSLKASFGGLWLQISSQVIPALERFIKSATEIVVKIRQWSEEHPRLSKGLTEFALAAGVLLTVLGGLTVILAKVISSLQILSVVFPGVIALVTKLGVVGAATFAGWKFGEWLESNAEKVRKFNLYLIALWNTITHQPKGPAMEFGWSTPALPAAGGGAAPGSIDTAGGASIPSALGDLTDKLAVHAQKQKEINEAYLTGRITAAEYYAQLNTLNQDGIVQRENELASINSFMQTIQSMHKTVTQTMFDFMNMAVQNFSTGLTTALTGIIMGTKKASEAFKEFGMSMITAIVEFVVQWAVQALIAMTLGKIMQASVTSTANAIAAAWLPAAILASVATNGEAALAGSLALGGAMGASVGMFAGLQGAMAGVQVASPTGGGGGWAQGGAFMVNKPTMFLAGEAGPEHVQITPEGQGGGGSTVNINFYDTKVSGETDINQLAEQLGYQIEERLRYMKRA